MHIILLKTLSGFNNFYFRSFLSQRQILCNKPQIIYFPRNKFSLLLKWSKQPNKDYCSLTISCMKKKCFVCSVKLPPSCCLKYMPEVFVLGEERHGNEVLSVIFSSMFMILQMSVMNSCCHHSKLKSQRIVSRSSYNIHSMYLFFLFAFCTFPSSSILFLRWAAHKI